MKTADKEKRSVIPEKRQRKAKSKKSLVANSYNSRLPLMNEPIGMTDHLTERKQHLSVTKYLPERMQADAKCHFLMSLRYFPTEHAFQNAIDHMALWTYPVIDYFFRSYISLRRQ